MKVCYDMGADLSLIKEKRFAIIGCGSRCHALALSLSDSNVTVAVAVGLCKGNASRPKLVFKNEL